MPEIDKESIRFLVEPSIFDRLPPRVEVREGVQPEELVTWNRLDIGMRTLYLELQRTVPSLAEKVYRQDLKAQTLGSMIDPDNSQKDGWQTFQRVFDAISFSIERDGFNSAKTILPVSSAGSILNGGHRLSAALVHGRQVSCVYTNLEPIICDYEYFFDRAVPIDIIERSARQLMRYGENIFLAFLWPSGSKYLSEAERLFENVILKREIELKENGPFNLLYQCYHHMEWIGDERSGYSGLQQKVVECFPKGGGLAIVIAFQAPRGVSEARLIKERIREINGIGFSSVHITDTKEEALRIADLVFNENGRHYLNYAKPIRTSMVKRLRQLHQRALDNRVDPKDFLIDGSWLLELYGIRKAEDIDILASPLAFKVYEKLDFDRREEQLIFHRLTENDLIFDSSHHFTLFGVKVVAFRQLHLMKAARGESKDKDDVKLMSLFLSDRPCRALGIRLKQRLTYSRLKSRRQVSRFVAKVLGGLGLYDCARALWQAVKPRR